MTYVFFYRSRKPAISRSWNILVFFDGQPLWRKERGTPREPSRMVRLYADGPRRSGSGTGAEGVHIEGSGRAPRGEKGCNN